MPFSSSPARIHHDCEEVHKQTKCLYLPTGARSVNGVQPLVKVQPAPTPLLFEERGIFDAKGIGELHTRLLAGRRSALPE